MIRHDDQRRWDLHLGDSIEVLSTFPDRHFHTAITSPPYLGQRDYEHDGQGGMQETLASYVEWLVAVFAAVHPKLRDDGTLWLNLGDKKNGSGGAGGDYAADGKKAGQPKFGRFWDPKYKRKDLLGVPWAVAHALRDWGWYLRRDVIWEKSSGMSEGGVRDSPSCNHEYVFLLAKSERYFYDLLASAEPTAEALIDPTKASSRRNRRTVWRVAPSQYKGAHFATYPPKLVEPMLLSSTSEAGCCAACGAPLARVIEKVGQSTYEALKDAGVPQEAGLTTKQASRVRNANGSVPHLVVPEKRTVGWKRTCACDGVEGPGTEAAPCRVLDPFNGAATTGLVALQHGRSYTGIDVSLPYLQQSADRLRATLGIVAANGEIHAPLEGELLGPPEAA